MTDGLDELGRANPTTPEAVERLVAMDRRTLLAMLEADSEEGPCADVVSIRPSRSAAGDGSIGAGPPSRSATRVAYVGAMVAAAAAFIGVATFVGRDRPTELEQVEPTEESTVPAIPLVVEGVDDEPATNTSVSTTAPAPDSAAPEDGSDDAPEETSASGQPVAADQDPAPATESETPAEPPGGSDPPATIEIVDGPFDQSRDLLVLHYDHAHLDDGHATVAALEISTSFGLAPHVVAGTRPPRANGYVHAYEPVMRAAWGDGWLDAGVDWSAAVHRSADRWLTTVDAGGRIWVAEGGVADFTADVVGEIQRRRPGLDTRAAVHVVQHSGSNEAGTEPQDMDFVRASTSYERIDDGNSTNGTAGLNQPSGALETAALAGPNSASWAAAFEYLAAAELDFSDTVEVLHILGVGIDEVADPDGFAARFMG